MLLQDLINAFNGIINFQNYTSPLGQVFIMLSVYLFSILLVSFLVAMFINQYEYLWGNIDALKRMNIIMLKNKSDFDRLNAGITITFFPISILVLPLIPFIAICKSEKLNEFALKIQYGIMIVMYIFIGLFLSIPLIPVLYVKAVWN